jgi:hypothetical protein
VTSAIKNRDRLCSTRTLIPIRLASPALLGANSDRTTRPQLDLDLILRERSRLYRRQQSVSMNTSRGDARHRAVSTARPAELLRWGGRCDGVGMRIGAALASHGRGHGFVETGRGSYRLRPTHSRKKGVPQAV